MDHAHLCPLLFFLDTGAARCGHWIVAPENQTGSMPVVSAKIQSASLTQGYTSSMTRLDWVINTRMFLGGEEGRWSSWGRFNSRRVSLKVGLPSIAQLKEQTSSKRQVPGLNPGGRSIITRCIGSRLYRVEMITHLTWRMVMHLHDHSGCPSIKIINSPNRSWLHVGSNPATSTKCINSKIWT